MPKLSDYYKVVVRVPLTRERSYLCDKNSYRSAICAGSIEKCRAAALAYGARAEIVRMDGEKTFLRIRHDGQDFY